uniref:Flavin-containing monooxygenase n=1 Tax=Rhodosorus marinus TaxID=101924 RepID=A0A7S2ZUP5_9RHOD|mmetsp:Transcript_31799/g.123417  ORF Transcript_31799/g.123417 Transcript_31799/m.123417 type:complete len:499 (+) Transcript_31799:252-1748(+)
MGVSGGRSGFRVAVVGAGIAGVATTRVLSEHGFDCVVFEKHSKVGGLWSDNYYGASVQMPKSLYMYPDEVHDEDASEFMRKDEVCDYLERIIDKHDIRNFFRFNTLVTDMTQIEGGLWRLTVKDLKADVSSEETFDYLVMCNGTFSSKPHRPSFPGQEKFEGKIIHSSEWRSPDEFDGKKIVIVGNGKSAVDASMVAGEVGERAVQLVRRMHWFSTSHIGFIPTEKVMFTRLFQMMLPPFYSSSSTYKTLHKLAAPVRWLYFRTLEALMLTNYRLPRRLWPKSRLELDMLQTALFDGPPKYRAALRSGKIDLKMTGIDEIKEKSVVLSSGEEVEADLIVLATGWDKTIELFNEEILNRLEVEEDGIWMYKNILPPGIDRMAFIGSNAFTAINPMTHVVQAKWLAAILTNEMPTPSRKEMEQDIWDMKQSRRAITPMNTMRASCIQLHMQSYHDDLLKDMNVNIRKRSGLMGWIEHYFYRLTPAGENEVVKRCPPTASS